MTVVLLPVYFSAGRHMIVCRSKLFMFLKNIQCLIFLLLAGCSSISIHAPMEDVKKEVVELSYCVVSSSEMATVKDALSDDENMKEFNDNINAAINDISKRLQAGIEHTPDFHIISLPECIDDITLLNHPSDLYLTIELSGYGSLKEDWKNVLVGTGIAEGVIQGIIVGAATSNPWIGVAVGAEEIISEYLTWNGVDWVLGEAYAPVTLEGSLLYVKKNEIIWQDSSFVTENEDVLTEVEKKDKKLQLQASLHKAEEELLSSLNEYLQYEILINLTGECDATDKICN